MSRREGGMTLDDWREVLRIAATIWPQSQSFFDDPPGAEQTPTRTWWAALSRFETDDVLTAIGRLGMASRFWPSLAELVEATRQVIGERREREHRAAQDAVLVLRAPRQDTVAERLAVFDQTAALGRVEHQAELRRVAITCGLDPGGLGDDVAPGPWEKRLRELVDRDWPAVVTTEPGDERSTADRVDCAASGCVEANGGIGWLECRE